MGFLEAVKTCFKKFFTFSGRASRSEYWYFVLFLYVIYGCIVTNNGFVKALSSSIYLSMLYATCNIASLTAATVRRLHDIDKQGLWYFVVLGAVLSWFFILLSFFITILPMEKENAFLFIAVITFISFILLIISLTLLCTKGTEGDNRFGPDPLQSKN